MYSNAAREDLWSKLSQVTPTCPLPCLGFDHLSSPGSKASGQSRVSALLYSKDLNL